MLLSMGAGRRVSRWRNCRGTCGFVTSVRGVTCCRTHSRRRAGFTARQNAAGKMGSMPYMPPFIPPTRHADAESALAQVREIYSQQIGHLRDAMQRFVAGEDLPGHVRACYPFVRVHTDTLARQA